MRDFGLAQIAIASPSGFTAAESAPTLSDMGMRPTDREVENRAREDAKRMRDANRSLYVVAVKRWNEEMGQRHKPRYSPAVGVAIDAGFPFLEAFCPGCRQVKMLDLRKLEQHRNTTLEALIPKLSCRNCQPHPPFAKLLRLCDHDPAVVNRAPPAPKRQGFRSIFD
jgi:hypothetical protein